MRLRSRRTPAAHAFRDAGRPALSAHWLTAPWCAIDLELTRLHRDGEIIAIGAVPVRDGRAVLGEALYTLARPARSPAHATVLVHKLRTPDLEQAPPLIDGIERLLATLAGCVPVFHTAAVEQAFLGREFRRLGLRLPAAADTEALGRLWLGHRDGIQPQSIRLASLAEVLGQRPHRAHHALGDALTTAQAFIALASHLDALQTQTVGRVIGAPSELQRSLRLPPQ
jgi:DNA polymerase-3 subunit epsilon